MKVGPKSSLRLFLHRALQLFTLNLNLKFLNIVVQSIPLECTQNSFHLLVL